MPGHSPPGGTARRALAARVAARLQRVILSALMSVAVVALERRLRKAFRSPPKTGTEDG
jgi:hypothetical protein